MHETWEQIDPAWAWSAFGPTPDRAWTRSLAAHLFRRATFAATPAELDAAVKAGPAAAIAALFATTPATTEFASRSDSLAETMLLTGEPKNLSAWWLHRMLQTPQPLLEKLTLFWHGHFATSGAKVDQTAALLAQNQLLRRLGSGRFEALAQAVSADPAMLLYLDSATNRKSHPNENFARELMELFCLGLGNYPEADIREVARCFTGWEVRDGRYRFNELQFDRGNKSIFGRSGNFSGQDAVRIVCEQPAAPRFIASKLCRYYLCDEPALPDRLLQPLADDFQAHDLDVAHLVRRIISSNLFFSPLAVGRKIRSPVELGIGLLRSLEGTTSMYRLRDQLAEAGQSVLYPPNVKGWDGGRTWLNASTLLTRANVVRELVLGSGSRFGDTDLGTLAARRGWRDAPAALDGLAEPLLAVPLAPAVRQRLIAAAPAGAPSAATVGELIHALATLPEFQLA